MLHVRLREWQVRGPEDPELRGAALSTADGRALAARLARAGVLEITELRGGLRVSTFAHVGRIQLDDLVVTIEPKLGSSELLALLRYAYGLRNLQLFDSTGFSSTGEILQDLIAAQLRAEVGELVERGLVKKYVSRTEELASPRGRIDMVGLARRVPLVDARLPCRHHPRSADHVLNQVVRAGVKLASAVAQSLPLRRSLAGLDARLAEEIEDLRLGLAVLAETRRKLDRLSAAYDPAVRLTELLFACSAISLDGDTTTRLPGFLFDMNRFFQALMGRFLAEHLDGREVRDEQSLTELMRYMPGLNPRHRRSPSPRPHFSVARAGALGYVALRPVILGELIAVLGGGAHPGAATKLAYRLAFGGTDAEVAVEREGTVHLHGGS